MDPLLRFKNLGGKIYLRFFGRYALLFLLSRELDSKGRILDVGCGQASPLALVNKLSYRVGLDFFNPFILISKRKGIHDDYVLADARYLPFKPKSFDCAVATEILEHLGKHEGPRTIKQMEEVAGKIILTTPNGFFQVYAGQDALNPMERHLSGWTVSELKELGFKVYGLQGLKMFWKAAPGKVFIRFKPRILFTLLCFISELFVYSHPSLAFQLFCVKKVH
jgi:SAM-dependent methyltransferase